jgi:hypothetical protein
MGARVPALLAVVVVTAVGCIEKNPDYCADAGLYHYSCARQKDAGVHEVPEAGGAMDASDVADTADAPSAFVDALEAPAEKPMCMPTSCATDGGAPICDVDAGGVCRACTTGAECTARDMSLHSCASGQCFACTTSPECSDVANQPICAAHVCRACASAAECVTRNPSLHGCETDGECFACTKNAECTDAVTSPICDSHKCRGCLVDADCKGVGAEVCMEDGSCLLATDAIFAEARAIGCPGAGTAASPYCAAQKAVDQAVAGSKKAVLLVGTGIFAPISVNATGKSLAIIAKDPVVLEPGNDANTGNPNIGVSLTDGDLLVRGLEIRKGNTTAVDAEGGVIRLHRCFIHDNAESGLVVKKAGFHVENTVFASNGGGTKANVDLEATTSTVKVFRNDTVIGGAGALAGIVCAQPYSLTGIIAFGGPTPIGAGCSAMDDCATMCSGHDPKLDPTTFTLTAATPNACIDKLAATDAPAIDRAGKLRPIGPLSDCGADEKSP